MWFQGAAVGTQAHRTNTHKKQTNCHKSFQKGIEQFRKSLTPSLDTLLRTSRSTTDDDAQAAAGEYVKVSSARMEEEDVVHAMLQDWVQGAVGCVPSVKPDNVICGYGENANSLRWFDCKRCKVPRLLKLLKRYDVDGCHVIETQTHFDIIKEEGEQFGDKVGVGRDRKCITANNMHETGDRCQQEDLLRCFLVHSVAMFSSKVLIPLGLDVISGLLSGWRARRRLALSPPTCHVKVRLAGPPTGAKPVDTSRH